MGAIAGELLFEKDKHVNPALLDKMIDVMAHRGPDAKKIWIKNNIGLAGRRWRINDNTSAGDQPLFNEDQTIAVLCDGEIYNHKTLRALLIERGHRFASHSDAEVIAHCYEEYGKDQFLKKLNGMFGLAVVDIKNGLVILARDRFGLKPLCYRLSGSGLSFASEIKGVVANRAFPLEIDRLALNLFFMREIIPAPYTIYKGIRKLCSGECLILNLATHNHQVLKYWCHDFRPDYSKSVSDWEALTRELLPAAINKQIDTDISVGTFLSGGIDSGAIAAITAKKYKDSNITINVGFEDKSVDESAAAAITARYIKSRHFEVKVSVDNSDILSKLVDCYDEPFGDSSSIPSYYGGLAAGQHVKAVLTGDGGDSVFAGYYGLKKIKLMGSFFLPNIIRPIFKSFNNKNNSIQKLSLPRWLMLASLPDHIFNPVRESVLSTKWRLKRDDILATYSHMENAFDDLPALSAFLAITFDSHMPDQFLTKMDRSTAAFSVENRSPLLECDLTESLFKMPRELLYQDGVNRYLMRKVLKDDLPSEIFSLPKHGFHVPMEAWGKSIWRKKLNMLFQEEPQLSDFIDLTQADKWNGPLVWNVLFFAQWFSSNKGRLT